MGLEFNNNLVTNGLTCLLDSTNPKSWSQNTHPNPLDIGSWVTSGNQVTITRDFTIDPSPVGGVPMKFVTSGTSAYVSSYQGSQWNLSAAANGQTWTFSFYAKAAAAVQISVLIFECDSSGNYITYSQPYFNITTSWARYSGSRTFNQGTTAFIQVRMDCYVNSSTIWTDGWQIERGGTATTFNAKRNVNSISWYDISGSNNHGTLYNFTGASAGSTSGFDTNTKFMMFDRHLGTSDATVNNYVGVPNSTSLVNCLCQNGFTVNFWLKMTTYYCTAVTKWNGSWEIYYCSSLVFRTQGTGGSDFSTGLGYTTYFNTFHNITVTHDGYNRRVYINGSLYNSDTNNLYGQNTSDPIGIGAYHGGTYAFVGAIPVYMVYNRVLNQGEVQQNYGAFRGEFGV